MRRLLLDQNLPKRLRMILAGYDVATAYQMGWAELGNGDLLKVAEKAGFDLMLTADQNIQYQQNLSNRRLALVVLSTNFWPTILDSAAAIRSAVHGAQAGSYTTVQLARRPRRGPFPPAGTGA
jgi:hypothetical protein